MDVQKPISSQAFNDTAAALEAELAVCRRIRTNRARIGLAGTVASYIVLYATFDHWKPWVMELGDPFLIILAFALCIALPLFVVCGWATSTGEAAAYIKQVDHTLTHGNLLEDEVEELTGMIRQHPKSRHW
jgi:hypothetical protein